MNDQAEELRRMCATPCPTCDALRKLAGAQGETISVLRETLADLRATLVEVEWNRRMDGGDTCPACYAYKHYGHEPGCIVAAALNRSTNSACEGSKI